MVIYYIYYKMGFPFGSIGNIGEEGNPGEKGKDGIPGINGIHRTYNFSLIPKMTDGKMSFPLTISPIKDIIENTIPSPIVLSIGMYPTIIRETDKIGVKFCSADQTISPRSGDAGQSGNAVDTCQPIINLTQDKWNLLDDTNHENIVMCPNSEKGGHVRCVKFDLNNLNADYWKFERFEVSSNNNEIYPTFCSNKYPLDCITIRQNIKGADATPPTLDVAIATIAENIADPNGNIKFNHAESTELAYYLWNTTTNNPNKPFRTMLVENLSGNTSTSSTNDTFNMTNMIAAKFCDDIKKNIVDKLINI